MDKEKVIERIHEAIDMGVCVDLFMDVLELLKEQGTANIKEPDCRICGQSHCKYYHETRKPTDCKSYVRCD